MLKINMFFAPPAFDSHAAMQRDGQNCAATGPAGRRRRTSAERRDRHGRHDSATAAGDRCRRPRVVRWSACGGIDTSGGHGLHAIAARTHHPPAVPLAAAPKARERRLRYRASRCPCVRTRESTIGPGRARPAHACRIQSRSAMLGRRHAPIAAKPPRIPWSSCPHPLPPPPASLPCARWRAPAVVPTPPIRCSAHGRMRRTTRRWRRSPMNC